jgi:hypothetical protein
MALWSDRHLATLRSATALPIRGASSIKLQVRGSSSWLGRFALTRIIEAEYMAATARFGRKRPLPASFGSLSAPIGAPEADRRRTGF